MTKKTLILTSLILLAFLFLFLSCCKDCPTCPGKPVPGSYYVFIADYNQDNPGYIWIVDSKTDSLVDSILTPETYITLMETSCDGRYLATFAPDLDRVLIYDMKKMDTVVSISPSGRPYFTPDSNYLLLTSFSKGIVNKYGISDWGLLASDSIPAKPVCLFKTRPYLVSCSDGKEYYIYDYESMEIIKKDSLLRTDGTAPQAIEIETSSDDRYFYFTARPDKLFKYEIESDSVVDSISIVYGAYYGYLKCSLDGNYLFFTESTQSPDNVLGNFVIIDQTSFTLYRRIPTWGLNPFMPGAPVSPGRMALTPDNIKVFCDNSAWYTLPAIVINLSDISASNIKGLPIDCSSTCVAVGKEIIK